MTTAALADQLAALSAQVAMIAAQQNQTRAAAETPAAPRNQSTTAIHANGLDGQALSVHVPKMPPVSQGLQTPGLKALQLLGPPPRTWAFSVTSGLGHQLLDDPWDPLKAPPETPDQILSHQTMALNALVSHLVQGGDSIGLDYHAGGTSSSSTKGTIKREKLQQELAARQSGFFLALQQQILRKMNPSAILPRAEEEIQKKSPSLLAYLERYGGFKGQKEAGLTMWIFAHALDAAASGDFFATKEYLALGIMALEQSAFDAGDWGPLEDLPMNLSGLSRLLYLHSWLPSTWHI